MRWLLARSNCATFKVALLEFDYTGEAGKHTTFWFTHVELYESTAFEMTMTTALPADVTLDAVAEGDNNLISFNSSGEETTKSGQTIGYGSTSFFVDSAVVETTLLDYGGSIKDGVFALNPPPIADGDGTFGASWVQLRCVHRRSILSIDVPCQAGHGIGGRGRNCGYGKARSHLTRGWKLIKTGRNSIWF